MLDDTIAAVATPLGEGGIAVVRLSGPRALAVADASFRPAGKSSAAPLRRTHAHHPFRQNRPARHGRWTRCCSASCAPRARSRARTWWKSPATAVCSRRAWFWRRSSKTAPASAAPGEFTRRAFLNGRIDLAQAEAVADLIHSRTELALAAAQRATGRPAFPAHQPPARRSDANPGAHRGAH